MNVLRMIFRWLFHAVATISVMLLVCTVFFWIRTQSTSDMFRISQSDSTFIVHCHRNGMFFSLTGAIPPSSPRHMSSPPVSFDAQVRLANTPIEDANAKHFAFLGIHLFADPIYGWTMYPTGNEQPNSMRYSAFIPFPWLVLLFSLPPVTWLALIGRRPRYGPGHCAKCGYDVHGITGACPECGAAVPSSEGSDVARG